MNEDYIMRPGDTFVARECGCTFVVQSGPQDPEMAQQAPRCCCGHELVKVETPVMVQESIAAYDTPRPVSSGRMF
jgi:hypothetical protein